MESQIQATVGCTVPRGFGVYVGFMLVKKIDKTYNF